MNKLLLATLLSALVVTPAVAQFPAGTPRDDTGSRPSPMGNPTSQEKVETRKDQQGRTVTEDGRLVVPQPGEEKSTDPARHSAPGGPNDTSTDAGKLE